MWSLSFLLPALVELSIVSWCAFEPVRDLLPQLITLQDWLHIYQPTLSNIDVWLAVVLRDVCVAALVAAAPTASPYRYGSPKPSSHKQLRMAVSVVATAFEVLVMAKSATVAVGAPEQLWPDGHSPGATLHVRNVGLVYMYVSLVTALIGSLVQAGVGMSLIHTAQQQYEKPPEPGTLEAPLLGAPRTPHDTSQHSTQPRVSKAGQAAGAGGGKPGSGAGAADGKPGRADDNKAPGGRTVLSLLGLSAPDWHIITVAFMFGMLAALAQATIPYYSGQAIDYASIDPDRDQFQRVIVKLVVVSLLCGLAAGLRGCLFTIATARLAVRLRTNLFNSLLLMEVGFFDTTRTGEITSRLAADTKTVSDQVCLNLNVAVRSLTQAAMVLGFMFSASWRLTVVTFIVVPCVMVISKLYGRYFSQLAKLVQTSLAEANAVTDEVLSSMTTVKAYAAQDSAKAAHAVKLAAYMVLLVKEAIVYAGYTAANTFLPQCVAALVLFYGGRLVLNGQMSPGALVSFMLYQQSLSGAFQMLGDVYGALTAAVGAADKVLELMHRRPEFEERGGVVPASFAGRIELKDVHFSYPARPHHPVLRGLSLEVHPGQVVALVGPSGGGKSSVVRMVERFYVPQSGAVLIDGRDVGAYHPKWLRRQIALVSQEPVLYARSIRRNIIFGCELEDGVAQAPSQAEVEEAAMQANAHGFITSFPDGYDTDCGEKGVTLSGGQKQRLAIARALVRKPRVLLLDEATSALDTESEAMVQEALDRVMAGRTVLVIAHRLSTVQGADRIFVIGNGAVQEVGTHEELLSSPTGVYASLVKRQLGKSPSMLSLSQVTGVSGVTGLGVTGALTSVTEGGPAPSQGPVSVGDVSPAGRVSPESRAGTPSPAPDQAQSKTRPAAG